MLTMETHYSKDINSQHHIFTNSNSNKTICIWTETSYRIIEPCTCLKCYRLECFIITGNHYHRFIFRDCGSIYWIVVAEEEVKSNVEACDPITGPVWPRGWVELWLYSSMTSALEGGEWLAARPGRTLPPLTTRYHFTGGRVGPRAGLDRLKISLPPGFDPIVSRYTDRTTRPTM